MSKKPEQSQPDAGASQDQQQARELATHRSGDHYTINIARVDPAARNSIDPVYVGVNGVSYAIKRGANVVVPAAVVEALRNATETAYEMVGDGRQREMVSQLVQSYPFQILAGPHPRDKTPVENAVTFNPNAAGQRAA